MSHPLGSPPWNAAPPGPGARAGDPHLPERCNRMSHLIGTVHLKLDPAALGVEDMRQGFSAVALVGRHLFAACDETASLERLTYLGNGRFGDHRTYPLADLLDLPNPGQEVDLEGLAWASPYLWLVGSHSRRRGKPEGGARDDRMGGVESVGREADRHLRGRMR